MLYFRLCPGAWALLPRCAPASGHVVGCGYAALGRSSAMCVVLRRCCHALCFAAPEAPLSLIPGLIDAPPPLMRHLVLRRSRSLLACVCHPSWLPRCLLLWCSRQSADAYAWARGCSSALCETARGRFAAYCSVFPVAPFIPCGFFPWWLCCLLLRCSWGTLWACAWAGRSLRCLLWCRSQSLRCSVRCLSWWMYYLLLHRLWGSVVAFASARGCRLALGATVRATAYGRFAVCCCAAFVCSRARCVVLRGCCATSCTICLGASLLLTTGLVGARVPLVRLSVAVLSPTTPALLLAHLLCALFV